MKKYVALLLALVMVLGLVACGSSNAPANEPAAPAESNNEPAPAPAEVPAEMRIAMITDYGDITDQSFNQTTYEACQAWANDNGVDFRYYKPASDADAERVSSIETAIDDGYNVIVMPGFAFGPAIKETAGIYDDVIFIALDVSAGDLGEDYMVPPNLYSCTYQEELCGYMAGYAAVKLGYTKLGFLGGMSVPAVIRYGYGFVQGADAAAAEDGVEGVEVKYVYGNQFYGDADITAYMDTWYADGTEVVFACGGGIYTSAVDAAKKVNAKVIGVDVDQAGVIATYAGEEYEGAADMTVTSAMKGLAATVQTLLTAISDGTFNGGIIDTLGLVSEVPEENYVQLAGSTQYDDNFTVEDYEALVAAMFTGEIQVSSDTEAAAEDFATVITVDAQGNIK